MSRRANALIQAAFTYAQTMLGVLTGLVVTRFVVHTLGDDLYGLWLATGALMAYAALADMGTFTVMPWLFAEAEAQKDLDRKRSLVVHGLLAGVASGALYVAVALGLWVFFPGLMHLNTADRTALEGPLLVMVLAVAFAYPLRLFTALRNGMQDFKYMGPFQLAQMLANAIITFVLAKLGFGLYSLSIAAGFPPFITGLAALHRTRSQNSELLHGWPKPAWAHVRPILTSGTGTWLGSLGWQLMFATDSVIIASLGLRGQISAFVLTSRLCITLMQLCWVLPDSSYVGLANLHAEGAHERTAEVVRTVIRLTLFLSGGVVCVTLSMNAGFMSLWVGPQLFGGSPLNVIFAVDILVLCVVHALVGPASVLGNRMRVGLITLVNGALHIVLASLLGRHLGLCGVGIATAVSAMVTSIPVGIYLLGYVSAIKLTGIMRDIVLPWALRLLPCALAAAFLGWNGHQPRLTSLGRFGPVVAGGLAAAITGSAYVLSMRAFIRDLPFPARVRRILATFRLA